MILTTAMDDITEIEDPQNERSRPQYSEIRLIGVGGAYFQLGRG